MKITHLCFADDLMIFCGNSIQSAKVLSKALADFSRWSGLSPNPNKSYLYIAGTDSDYIEGIKWEFQFQLGSLPVKYLGLPLVSTRITVVDCKPLIDAITTQIKG